MMFRARDERRKWRAKWRAEAYAAGYAEGYAKGYAEGKVKTARRYDAWLDKVAEEKGIVLAERLPPQDGLE